MMKLMERVSLGSFSTLKFPEKYQRAFRLNHNIRSCLTLQALEQYYTLNCDQIDRYGKTYYLEYLNEYPVNYHTSFEELGDVYSTVLKFKDLSLYEQQLRHSNLIKWMQFSFYKGLQLKSIIQEHEEKMLQMIKSQPFDIVDAINWLVMRKTLKGNRLINHSLEVIKNSSLDKYVNLVAKMMNIIISKINDLEWVVWREYRQIFQFICATYKEPHKNISKQISNAYVKLSNLQLHLLGYDQVPIAIDKIYDKALDHLNELNLRSLEMLLGLQSLLPYNYVDPKTNALLFQQIFQKMEQQNLHFHILPLSRITPQLLNKLVEKIILQCFNIENTLYYINKPNISLIVNHPNFIEKLYHDFCKVNSSKKEYLKSNLSSLFNSAAYLLKFYKYDSKKSQYIKKNIKCIFDRYEAQLGVHEAMEMISLCSLFNVYFLNLHKLLTPNSKGIQVEIQKNINTFITKRKLKQWKTPISMNQLLETLHAFADTGEPKIKNLLINIFTKDLQKAQPFPYSYGATVLFCFQGSYNCYDYRSIIKELWTKFQFKYLSLADYYLMYEPKTVKLTSLMIFKLWERSKSFTSTGKILAHCDVYHLYNHQGLLFSTSNYFAKNVNNLTQCCLRGFSKGEIASLLKFFRCYYKDVPRLADKFLSLVTDIMKKDPNFFLKSKSPFNLEDLCLQTLLLSQLIQDKQAVLEKLQNFWLMCPKKAQNSLISLYYKVLIGQDCWDERRALSKKLQQKSQNFSLKQDLIRILVLKLEEVISLTSEAEDSLISRLKEEITNFEVNPLKIKELTESCFFPSSSIKSEQMTQSLRQLLVWLLKNIQVQFGPEFYTWCIYLGHQYKDSSLISESLNWLTIKFIDPALAVNLMNILQHYPDAVQKEFFRHLTYCVKENLPHSCEAYDPFIVLLKKVYGKIPNEYSELVRDMKEANGEKVWKKKKMFDNLRFSSEGLILDQNVR